MRVVWSPAAARDLEDVLGYISKRSARGAASVATAIDAAIASIELFPHAGRLDQITGCRERVVGRFPLLLVYAIENERAWIIALFHTSRDPETKRRP